MALFCPKDGSILTKKQDTEKEYIGCSCGYVDRIIKKFAEQRTLDLDSEQLKEMMQKLWDAVSFNESFIAALKFIGSVVKTGKNSYDVYFSNNLYFVFPKPKLQRAMFNIIKKEEVEIIAEHLEKNKDKFTDEFAALELKNSIDFKNKEVSEKLKIVEIIAAMDKNEGNPDRDNAYFRVLQCCYVLVALGKLELIDKGNKVFFKYRNREDIDANNENNNNNNNKDNIAFNQYSALNFIGRFGDESPAYIFKKENTYFYFTINNFRGSLQIISKEELELIEKTIEEFPRNTFIVEKIAERIDFKNKNNKAIAFYNEYEEPQYVTQRMRYGIYLLCMLGKLTREKEGRQFVFHKVK